MLQVVLKELSEAGKHNEVIDLASSALNQSPNDPFLHYMVARSLCELGRAGAAQPYAIRAAAIVPKMWEAWNILGRTQHDLWQLQDSQESFRLALQLTDKPQGSPLSNLAMTHHLRGDSEKAIEVGKKALQIEPDDFNAKNNLGMFYLSLRQWVPGWKYYEFGLGHHDSRKERIYGDEPRWDGSKGKTVVTYGEQGIGDEISFGGCIPELIRDSKQVIVECDHRLEGLFKRSFPCAVHGTRFREAPWIKDYEIDARCALGSLSKFYRRTDSSFPGKPYLVADPERRLQWRVLLDQLPGIKVGIAWTGGTPINGQALRSLSLTDLLPVLGQKCSFVSLEYRDPTRDIAEFQKETGIRIHEWGRATRTLDYDDTAALVAELDLVISVTTSVIHLAGALGKECWVLTHKTPMWRYGYQGHMPWYSSVKLYRQKTDWTYPILKVAEDLRVRLSQASPKTVMNSTAKTSSKPSRFGRRKQGSSSTTKART